MNQNTTHHLTVSPSLTIRQAIKMVVFTLTLTLVPSMQAEDWKEALQHPCLCPGIGTGS